MINPELANGQPVPMQNECFVLSRDGIHFTAKSGPRNKIDAYGSLYISTLRMIFVNEKAGSENRGFDIPLATLYKESFNQPIFGANNMTGLSPPLDLPEGADHWKWCISFRNGGVGTFLPFFFRLLQEMRRRMQEASSTATAQPASQGSTAPVAQAVPMDVAQGFVQAAFVDPSDPTKFYIPQGPR